jgi:hypothetical protein
VIAREKQRKLVGSGAITDGETDAKNASVDGPLNVDLTKAVIRTRAACSAVRLKYLFRNFYQVILDDLNFRKAHQ